MQLTHNIVIPNTYGKIVDKYLQTLDHGKYYDAFTLSDSLQIIQVKGIIQNNGRYHLHHNYDNSEDELFIRHLTGKTEKRFWTTSFEEIQSIRVQNIKTWCETLQNELKRYE
jgi:predicted DNA-binding protein with PD1-like motif